MGKQMHLTEADRAKFKTGAAQLGPLEVMEVSQIINSCGQFSKKDLRFMHSCLGRRCEQLLRNVVKNQSFDDDGGNK